MWGAKTGVYIETKATAPLHYRIRTNIMPLKREFFGDKATKKKGLGIVLGETKDRKNAKFAKRGVI